MADWSAILGALLQGPGGTEQLMQATNAPEQVRNIVGGAQQGLRTFGNIIGGAAAGIANPSHPTAYAESMQRMKMIGEKWKAEQEELNLRLQVLQNTIKRQELEQKYAGTPLEEIFQPVTRPETRNVTAELPWEVPDLPEYERGLPGMQGVQKIGVEVPTGKEIPTGEYKPRKGITLGELGAAKEYAPFFLEKPKMTTVTITDKTTGIATVDEKGNISIKELPPGLRGEKAQGALFRTYEELSKFMDENKPPQDSVWSFKTTKDGWQLETEKKPSETSWQLSREDKGSKYREVYYNPKTNQTKYGEWRDKEVSPGTETSLEFRNKEFAFKIMKEFEDNKSVQEYRLLKPRVQMADKALEHGKNTNNWSFADQAMVVIFNKFIDPTSVVRESEFARTPEFIAMMNKIAGWLPKLQQGGAGLTLPDREDMVKLTKKMFKVYENIYKDTENRFKRIAKGLEVPDKYMGGLFELPSEGIGGGIMSPSEFFSQEERKKGR